MISPLYSALLRAAVLPVVGLKKLFDEWEVGERVFFNKTLIPTRTRRCNGRLNFGSIATGPDEWTGKVIRKSPEPEDRPEDWFDACCVEHSVFVLAIWDGRVWLNKFKRLPQEIFLCATRLF
jgi:hypothetical protein